MLVCATLEGSLATLQCLSYFLALTVVAFYAFFFLLELLGLILTAGLFYV